MRDPGNEVVYLTQTSGQGFLRALHYLSNFLNVQMFTFFRFQFMCNVATNLHTQHSRIKHFLRMTWDETIPGQVTCVVNGEESSS